MPGTVLWCSMIVVVVVVVVVMMWWLLHGLLDSRPALWYSGRWLMNAARRFWGKTRSPIVTETLKQVLMRRDGMTSEEADEAIAEAKEMLANGEYEDPEECLACEFGLEPDYVWDLMGV